MRSLGEIGAKSEAFQCRFMRKIQLFAKGQSYQDLIKAILAANAMSLDNRHLAATQVARKRVSVRQRLEDAKMPDSLV